MTTLEVLIDQQSPSQTTTKKTYEIKVMSMTPLDWSTVPANPRQRDTERRLRNTGHLLIPNATHSQVSMAQDRESGQAWKLDGHTRDLFWQRNPDLAPTALMVLVYPVDSEAEAMELYTFFDSPAAVETPRDRLSGALRQAKWEPQSTFMRNMNFTLAIALAEGLVRGKTSEIQIINRGASETIYDLLPLWYPELFALDDLDIVSKRFPSPVLCAALLTLRKRGPKKAIEFWRAYNNDQGIKLENNIDGVEALTRIVASSAPKNRQSRHQLLSKAISCFEAWRRGHDYSTATRAVATKSTDVSNYLQDVKSRRETEADL